MLVTIGIVQIVEGLTVSEGGTGVTQRFLAQFLAFFPRIVQRRNLHPDLLQ